MMNFAVPPLAQYVLHHSVPVIAGLALDGLIDWILDDTLPSLPNPANAPLSPTLEGKLEELIRLQHAFAQFHGINLPGGGRGSSPTNPVSTVQAVTSNPPQTRP